MATALCAAAVAAPPAGAAPLQQELKDLLSGHPEVRAAADDWRAARKRIDQAEAPYLPSVTLSADKGYEHIDSPSRRASQGEASSLTREKLTLEMSYNLFDGHATEAGVGVAQSDARIARLNLRSARQRVLLQALQAYWRVRQFRRQLDIINEQIDTIRQQADLRETLAERGSGVAIESLLARGRLETAINQRIQLERQLVNAEAAYERLFDQPPPAGEMPAPPQLTDALPVGLQAAIDRAEAQNPNIDVAAERISKAQDRIRQAQAGWYPKVDLVGTANWENNVDAVRGIRRDQSIVVRGTWKLFDGFETQSASEAAGYQKSAAQDRNRAARRKIAETVRRAWNTLQLNRDAIATSERLVEVTQRALEARRDLVEAGRETKLVLLDTRIELFLRQRQLVSARTQARLSVYQLLFALGELTPATLDLDGYQPREERAAAEP